MKTILVVDNEEAIRQLYQEELTEEGYRVIVAKDAPEALERVREGVPDCVTVDVKMPGMDGIELVRRLRDQHRNLPIIICTAYGEFKQDFGTWASDAYLTKSADVEELKAKIRELVGPA